MYVDTLCRQISVCRCKDSDDGVDSKLLAIAESDLREHLAILNNKCYNIVDIKVNHFTVENHNNGGYNEVWVQYTILYK